jgi:hypothetical protein
MLNLIWVLDLVLSLHLSLGLWNSLLATENCTSARIGAGENFSSVFPNCTYVRAKSKIEPQPDNVGTGSPDKLKRLGSTVGASQKKSTSAATPKKTSKK